MVRNKDNKNLLMEMRMYLSPEKFETTDDCGQFIPYFSLLIKRFLADIIQKGGEISPPPEECSWEAGSFQSGPEILRY